MNTLLVAVLSVSSVAAPSARDAFWTTILTNAGEKPLAALGGDRALRVVRVPLSLVTATIVTVERSETGVHLTVKESRDRREPSNTSRVLIAPLESWDSLRQVAEAALWKQREVLPAGSQPAMHDGVLWLVEGTRHGEHWAIVRHDPDDPAFLDFVSSILRLARLPDQVPR